MTACASAGWTITCAARSSAAVSERMKIAMFWRFMGCSLGERSSTNITDIERQSGSAPRRTRAWGDGRAARRVRDVALEHARQVDRRHRVQLLARVVVGHRAKLPRARVE